ncbi:MAG: DUF2516 family protein [Nonomuraea sp.]|nr:DUF2516 family protein [Nonomuraea sp.]
MSLINSVLNLLFLVLAAAILGMSAYALVHALRVSAGAFQAAGKLNKNLWLLILAVATLVSGAVAWLYLGAFMAIGGAAFIGLQVLFSGGIFTIAAIVASAIYLVDVRPAVQGMGGRGGSSSGPYGPW